MARRPTDAKTVHRVTFPGRYRNDALAQLAKAAADSTYAGCAQAAKVRAKLAAGTVLAKADARALWACLCGWQLQRGRLPRGTKATPGRPPRHTEAVQADLDAASAAAAALRLVMPIPPRRTRGKGWQMSASSKARG